MSVLIWLWDAALAILYSVGWIVFALRDLVVWLFWAVIWFVQWLPQRLLGQTDEEMPVGKTAKRAFDHVHDSAQPFFDGLADALEAMIDAILWVLQGPPPLLVVAVFVALTWALQRSWRTCLLVAVGFLFILDQDYWEETTESLALVLSACLVCMANDAVIAQRNCLSAEARPSRSDERLHILRTDLVPAALELREEPIQSKVSIELLANSDPEKQPMTPFL
jgi:hypothetical protein